MRAAHDPAVTRRRVGLAPSVIAADFSELGSQLRAVEPYATRWHIDVMDGHYVPNLTIGPLVMEAIRTVSRLPQDAHLMVTNPGQTWDWYAKAGASRIAFHPETAADVRGLLRAIAAAGVGPGLALNPDEGLEVVEPYLEDVDHLIVMSVRPGFAGQRFIPEVLPKLRALRELVDTRGLRCELICDGGINLDNAKRCVEAGADLLVSASAVFGAANPAEVAAGLASVEA